MATQYYYYVHDTGDPESRIICEGKCSVIVNRFHIGANTLNRLFTIGRYYLPGGNFIERVELSKRKDKEEQDRRKKRSRSKFEKQINSIEHHLDVYKNTIIYKDSKRIEDRLEKDGYHVRLIHEPKRIIKSTNVSHSGCEVYPECWIIELIGKDEINND